VETRIIEEAAARVAAEEKREEEEAARKALAGLSDLLQKKQAEQQGRLPEESRASQRPLRVLTPAVDETTEMDEEGSGLGDLGDLPIPYLTLTSLSLP
jgi:hypothetical protein